MFSKMEKRSPPTTDAEDSRNRKEQEENLTSEESDCELERPRKKLRVHYYSSKRPEQQSCWGNALPRHILAHIFSYVCNDVGCLPFLVRASRVCQLWYQVSLTKSLWKKVDLSETVKPAFMNEAFLKWMIENRLAPVRELTIGNWQVDSIESVLTCLNDNCKFLRSLTVERWLMLGPHHLELIAKKFENLTELKLTKFKANRAVGCPFLSNFIRVMSGRLTHFGLTDSTARGIPQIISSFTFFCPNLKVLDISNLRMTCTAMINLDVLQEKCSGLKVIKMNNSSVAFSPVPMTLQDLSPGFPELEEFSAAFLGDPNHGDTVSSYCKPFIDDEVLKRVLNASVKLKVLDVRGHPSVKGSCFGWLPAENMETLLIAGCRMKSKDSSGLKCILDKWSHSLKVVDLSWITNKEQLDGGLVALGAVDVLHGKTSRLRSIKLCGSAVGIQAVKAVLECPWLELIDLSSCRSIPRGMKKEYVNEEIYHLRSLLGVDVSGKVKLH